MTRLIAEEPSTWASWHRLQVLRAELLLLLAVIEQGVVEYCMLHEQARVVL